jgi:hypothetical protein
MQKVPKPVRIAGSTFELDRAHVEERVAGVLPEPLRDHYVVVQGRRFPPKQVLALATGLDRADFTTHQARGVLRRLGLVTGRLNDSPERAEHLAGDSSWGPDDLRYAEELRPHRGQFVAVDAGRVLVATEDPMELVRWLESHDRSADSVFRVPLDPSTDMGGFPG